MEQTTALTLPDEETFRSDIQAINKFQQVVRANMIEGQDFGVIPGTTKPTLLKPGAEKIAKLLGLADHYEILDRQEDWQRGFFRYLIKCQLIAVRSDIVISEGLGECNSMEVKYRWREKKRICPFCERETIIKGKAEYGGGWLCFKKIGGCGKTWEDGAEVIEKQETGRVENEEIYDQVNTLLKMAKKRSLVDAALSAGRLSQVFTQDIEDIPGFGTAEGSEEPKKVEKPKTTKAKSAKKQAEEPKNLYPEDPPHAAAAAKAAEEATGQREAEEPGPTMEWFKESLKTLRDKGVKVASESNLLSFMKTTYKVEATTVLKAIETLDEGPVKHFKKQIQDMLEMA